MLREVYFVPGLPKTRSGKIMHSVLRAPGMGRGERRHLDPGERLDSGNPNYSKI